MVPSLVEPQQELPPVEAQPVSNAALKPAAKSVTFAIICCMFFLLIRWLRFIRNISRFANHIQDARKRTREYVWHVDFAHAGRESL